MEILATATSQSFIAQYQDLTYSIRTNCLICENALNNTYISLPKLPITEIYIDFKPTNTNLGTVDQEFYFCEVCGHGQLLRVIDPQLIYQNNCPTNRFIY